MPSYKDDFQRANGPLGHPWSVFRGSVAVSNGRAVSDATPPGAMAVINAGYRGNNGTVEGDLAYSDIYQGGHALYFRVVDEDSWWRYSVKRASGTYTYDVATGTESYISHYESRYAGTRSTYVRTDRVFVRSEEYQTGTEEYVIGYNYTTVWSVFVRGNDQFIGNESRTNFYPTEGWPAVDDYSASGVYAANVGYSSFPEVRTRPTYAIRDVYEDRDIYEEQPYYETYPVYATRTTYTTYTGTDYYWVLNLHNSFFGTLNLIDTVNLQGTQPTALKVVMKDDLISCYYNVVMSPVITRVSTTYQHATRHGLGYSTDTQFGNAQGFENFSLVTDYRGYYVRTIML